MPQDSTGTPYPFVCEEGNDSFMSHYSNDRDVAIRNWNRSKHYIDKWKVAESTSGSDQNEDQTCTSSDDGETPKELPEKVVLSCNLQWYLPDCNGTKIHIMCTDLPGYYTLCHRTLTRVEFGIGLNAAFGTGRTICKDCFPKLPDTFQREWLRMVKDLREDEIPVD